MVGKDVLAKYQPTIGIECHVQLKTTSKLFARVNNDARAAPPNTTVSTICFGLPGVLPYLNEAALELAIRAGLALNATINPRSTFDRKHYFYPDLPKGYQITQYAEPIIGDGWVEIDVDGQMERVGIERAHLEEDAGKLTHPADADYSLVDLNRAGTPLLEIVSKPDIHSAVAAKAYARELYLLMKYADVSDVDLYHGHMRFDVNISVANKDKAELGTRAEIKNLNSFRAVEKAAQYEFERQVELLVKGEKIVQETRGWNEDKQKTFSQRSKEQAHDYRYFPEPDLPPVDITEDEVSSIKTTMQPLPNQIRHELVELGIDIHVAETILSDPKLAARIKSISLENGAEHAKRIALWFINAANDEGVAQDVVAQNIHLVKLSELVAQDKVSSAAAKGIFIELRNLDRDPLSIAEERQLLQMSDSDEIEKIVLQVIADNPRATEDIKKGEMKAIGFLVGQVMGLSKGQANPKLAHDLVKKHLGL